MRAPVPHAPLPTRSRVVPSGLRSDGARVLYCSPCRCGWESEEGRTVEEVRSRLSAHLAQYRR